MISWRLAIPAVLGAAAVAGCITYLVTPAPPPQAEANPLSPPTWPKATSGLDSGISTNIQHPSREDHVTAYQRAADAILKRAQNARASADEPLVTGRVPLPTRRPTRVHDSGAPRR
jgi:hypothetical protein